MKFVDLYNSLVKKLEETDIEKVTIEQDLSGVSYYDKPEKGQLFYSTVDNRIWVLVARSGYSTSTTYTISISKDHMEGRDTTSLAKNMAPSIMEMVDKHCFGKLYVGSRLINSVGHEFIVDDLQIIKELDKEATNNRKINPLSIEIFNYKCEVKITRNEDGAKPFKIDISKLLDNYAIITGVYGTTADELVDYLDKSDNSTIESSLPVVADEGGSTHALVATDSQSHLYNRISKMQEDRNSVALITYAANRKVMMIKNEVMGKIAAAAGMIAKYSKAIGRLARLVATLEIFAGLSTKIYQIKSGDTGKGALTLRQMVLYMDEEVGDPRDQGIDFNTIDQFDEWVSTGTNYEILVPESRCMVAIKPRRKDKHYTDDAWANSIYNIENHKTYILIRNGDNLYRIWDDNIAINDVLVPTTDQLQEMYDRFNSDSDYYKNKADDAMFTYTKVFILINGLAYHTDIFAGSVPTGFNSTDPSTYANFLTIIKDKENIIDDGKPRYKEYLRSINDKLQPGSRVYFDKFGAGLRLKRAREYDEISSRYVVNLGMLPPGMPPSGIYEVKKVTRPRWGKDDEELLCIRYNPKDTVYTSYGHHPRKVPLSFIIYPSDEFVFNYDELELEKIEYYLKSRLDRQYYLDMMPVLFNVVRKRKEEMVWESAAAGTIANQLNSECKSDHIDDITTIVLDCIEKYKLEVKWKRPIYSNDIKAIEAIKIEARNRCHSKISKDIKKFGIHKNWLLRLHIPDTDTLIGATVICRNMHKNEMVTYIHELMMHNGESVGKKWVSDHITVVYDNDEITRYNQSADWEDDIMIITNKIR